jgi:hypothetical protein
MPHASDLVVSCQKLWLLHDCVAKRDEAVVCLQVYLHLRLEAQRRRQQRDFQAEFVQVGSATHQHPLAVSTAG